MHYFILSVFFVLSVSACAQCLEGDCENGYGKYKCDCGYVFEGQFKNGDKVYGTLTKEDLVYTGEFENDVAHGKGRIAYKDSSWYEGDFRNNEANGYGAFHFADGWEYRGTFENDKFLGLGVLYNPAYDSFRIGIFENDALSGVGYRKSEGTSRHFGVFLDGSPAKLGVEISDEGLIPGVYKNKLKKRLSFQRENGSWVVSLSEKNGEIYRLWVSLDYRIMVMQIERPAQSQMFVYDVEQNLFLHAEGEGKIGALIGIEGIIGQGVFTFENGIIKKK